MSYTLIQVAKVEGQFEVFFGFTKSNDMPSEYVVTYGCQVSRFPRTPSGMIEAVKEFESCYGHALTCAAPDVFDDE